MFEFFVELVEHAEEDDPDGDPLDVVDVVPEHEDAHYHAQDFPGRRHQRENVLLEVRNDVVNAHLSHHLQTRNPQNVDQGPRVVPDEHH